MISNATFLKRETRSFSKLYLMLDCAHDEPIYYQRAEMLCNEILAKIDKRAGQIKQIDLEMMLFEENVRAFSGLITRIINKREEK